MQSEFVSVSSNKTLGLGDDGTTQIVTAGVTITIPKDATFSFDVNDTITIFSDTVSSITVSGEGGVTVSGIGSSMQNKGGFMVLRKTGADNWIAFGNI